MIDVKTYTLSTRVSTRAATSTGYVSATFEPGDVTPKTDAEAAILEDLVQRGIATVKAASAPAPKSGKPPVKKTTEE